MVNARSAQEVAEKCRRTARALKTLGEGFKEVVAVLEEASSSIEDLSATWYFGSYQNARERAEAENHGSI